MIGLQQPLICFLNHLYRNLLQNGIKNYVKIKYEKYKKPFNGDLNNWNMDINKMSFEDKYQVFDNSPLENNPSKWYNI